MENGYYFESHDGKKIFVREWTPDGTPVGVVQIFHGMAEHSGRYAKLAEYLNESGYLVFADDHRAHGNTDKDTLGYCYGDIWNDTLRDEEFLNKKYRDIYPQLPYVIFGHSYGSFLLQAYIERVDNRLFDGVILSGSAKMQGAQVTFGKLVASLSKEKKPAEFIKKMSFDAYNKKFSEGSFVSGLKEETKRYYADEFCGFVCSNNFYKRFFGGLKGIYSAKNLAKINKNMPILLFSGQQDPVGNFGKSVKALYDTYVKAGLSDVRIKLFPDSRHEVLNDVSREEGLTVLKDFITAIKR
ncbi:MAG: alpha/beta hydrolase [Clostridiales bacterium]|nr:alpha/beta hydrolase [Clostridiales bacterium]